MFDYNIQALIEKRKMLNNQNSNSHNSMEVKHRLTKLQLNNPRLNKFQHSYKVIYFKIRRGQCKKMKNIQ